jgi:hypothetical protein
LEKSLGSDCSEVVPILEQYAALLDDMKKTDEAKAMLARAEILFEKEPQSNIVTQILTFYES